MRNTWCLWPITEVRVVKEQLEVGTANVWRFYRGLEVSQYRALCLIIAPEIDSN